MDPVRRNHASRCGTKMAGMAKSFFRTENLLGYGDDDVRTFDANPDGSSRLPDPTLSINFAESNQDTSELTPPNFRKRHPEIAEWLFQIPCSRVQIPCSFAEFPCSAK